MAYLVGTIVEGGHAIALTGFIGNTAMKRWTVAPRRVEWADIVKRWPSEPSGAAIRKVKDKMPRVASDGDVSGFEAAMAEARDNT
ncbi:MAG: hypothetical protein V4527_18905 [Pseudomonadota bacterium]